MKEYIDITLINTRRFKYFCLTSLILAATVIRVFNLGFISIWTDEAFSLILPHLPLTESMHRIIADVHPPLYYIALRPWFDWFSDSAVSLRSFSVFFSVLSVVFVYLTARRAGLERVYAYLASVMFCFSWFAITYSQEGRMYAFGGFLILVATYSLLRYLTQTDVYLKIFWLVMLAIFMSASVYTHYYLLFAVAGLFIFWCMWLFYQKVPMREYVYVLLCVSTVALAYLPWLPFFIEQVTRVGGGYWIEPFTFWVLPSSIWEILFGVQPDNHKLVFQILTSVIAALVLLACAKVFFSTFRSRKQTRVHAEPVLTAVFAVLCLAPFAGALVFNLYKVLHGSHQSIFFVRYFYFALPFLILTIASALNVRRFQYLASIVFVGVSAYNLCNFVIFHTQLEHGNYTGMSELAKVVYYTDAGTPVYSVVTGEYLNLKYYLEKYNIEPRLYMPGITKPEQLPHYFGTALLSEQDFNYQETMSGADKIWMVWTTGFNSSEPKYPSNFQLLERRGFKDVRPDPRTVIYLDKIKIN